MLTAEFSKFAGILSVALSQHHLLGFEIAQLEFHHLGGGLVTKSCPTLMTSWIVVCQAPLFMEFSRQEHWSGLPFPSPGDLPDPGIEPRSPALQKILYQLSYEGSPHHLSGHQI